MTPAAILLLAALLGSAPGASPQGGPSPNGPSARSARSARGASTWYVAPTGSDSNDCASPGSPCATIGSALGRAAAGDVLLVALGTYTGTGTEVVVVTDAVTLSGGWETDFSAQTGRSVVDGESARRVLLVENGASATVEDFVLRNGHSFFNCVRSVGATLVLERCSIEDNSTTFGAVDTFGGTVTLRDSTVRDNDSGPGIRTFGGRVVLERCTVEENAGQGLAIGFGSAEVSSSVVRDNGGPGIESDGDVVVRASTIAGNSGGLLNFTGSLLVEDSAILANGRFNFGGVQNLSGNGRSGQTTLINTTVSGNTSVFGSGGIHNSGTLTLNNCTITANSGDDAGLHIQNNPGFTSISIQNTIVAGNSPGDVSGGFTTYPSGGFNLFGSVSPESIVPEATDLVGADPLLAPLADNGGPTLTHALLPGSPARDAANPALPGSGGGACEPLDQRGVARPVGSACDMGSFEAPTFLVTTTDDSGPGTLRQAILDANDSPGPDSITFSIPGAGPHAIAPLSALPAITQPVFLDGFSQPGATPNSRPFGQGTDAVLRIELDGHNAPFTSCLLIRGGETTVRGLVIRRFDILPILLASDGNTVAGNFIGTNVTGETGSSNGLGVEVDGSHNRIGGQHPADRNVISFNNGVGIRVSSGDHNQIAGNFIGTNANGTRARGNQFDGIELFGGAHHEVRDNLISGNGRFAGAGIDLAASNCTIQHNYIGTDVSGTLPLGNNQAGIYVQITATGNLIGGFFWPAGNVIAFNHDVYDQIGGGVFFAGSAGLATTNTVVGNSIHSNEALGIDLPPVGVNPNDALDLDVGQNDRQNYPVISWAEVNGNILKVLAELNSRPDTEYYIEFFSSSNVDPSGHGEGERLLGFETVTTNASGKAAIEARLDLFPTFDRISPAGFVTATATDPDGNTSEFSRCTAVGMRGRVR